MYEFQNECTLGSILQEALDKAKTQPSNIKLFRVLLNEVPMSSEQRIQAHQLLSVVVADARYEGREQVSNRVKAALAAAG